jgi:3'(2'), 5'-bisphosphate nucleotidase
LGARRGKFAMSLVTADDLGNEARLAMAAVADGMRVARCIQQGMAMPALTKRDASPVTVADFSVQALIASRLARHFPDDPLVAEEEASALRPVRAADLLSIVTASIRTVDASIQPGEVLELINRGAGRPRGRFWTLDPIDGTKGLLRGGQYVVALALIVDGTVRLGVIGCPRLSLGAAPGTTVADGLGGLAVAVRGGGAWWAPGTDGALVALSVSARADRARARVLRSFEAPHTDAVRFDGALRRLGTGEPPILMDSQAKHVVLAGGGADAMLRFPPAVGTYDAIWDQAAGSILIQEAGGRVTDLTGRPLDFSAGRRLSRNLGLVASNGLLHDIAMAAAHD